MIDELAAARACATFLLVEAVRRQPTTNSPREGGLHVTDTDHNRRGSRSAYRDPRGRPDTSELAASGRADDARDRYEVEIG